MKSIRIIQRFLPKGYSLEHRGRGKHITLIGPDGDVIRDPKTGMPVTFSNSPGGDWENKVKRDIKNIIKGV